MERPIFHHLEHRTQAHIFLCVLAYLLLAGIEKYFLDRGIHTSWWTLRRQPSTHQAPPSCCRLSMGPCYGSGGNHAGR